MKYFAIMLAMIVSLSSYADNSTEISKSLNDQTFTELLSKVEIPKVDIRQPKRTLTLIKAFCVRPILTSSVGAVQLNIDNTADPISRGLKQKALAGKLDRLVNSQVCETVAANT